MNMLDLLRREPRFIAFGFLYTFGSSAGQTFFISVFVPSIAAAMALNDAEFAGLYALATIASALTLPLVGRFIDRTDLVLYGGVVGVGLAVASVVTASATGPVMLAIGLFALRLFGQGLMTHTAITAAARWFTRDRGKALALTSLGHAAGEAMLPLTAVALIGFIGWRFSFLFTGIVLGVIVGASALYLIRRQNDFRRPFDRDGADKAAGATAGLASLPWFWAVLPLYIASPMLITALVFHQGAIAADLGKPLELFAASFVGFAITRVPGSLFGGPLVDRFTARAMLPLHLIPIMAGIALLALAPSTPAVFAYMALAGVTTGLSATVRSAAIAEIVGPARLGSARSLTSSLTVLSTALGPAAFGLLLTGGPFIPRLDAAGLLWVAFGWALAASLVGFAANRLLAPSIAGETA